MSELLDTSDPAHHKEVLTAYLIHHTGRWQAVRDQDERAAGMNAAFAQERRDTMAIVNRLLEDYFEMFVKVEDGKTARAAA